VSRYAGMHMRSCATVGPKSIAAADAIFRTQHKDAGPPLAAHGKAATKPRLPVSGIFDGNAYAVFISCVDRNGMRKISGRRTASAIRIRAVATAALVSAGFPACPDQERFPAWPASPACLVLPSVPAIQAAVGATVRCPAADWAPPALPAVYVRAGVRRSWIACRLRSQCCRPGPALEPDCWPIVGMPIWPPAIWWQLCAQARQA
jgi:hypothetical protein